MTSEIGYTRGYGEPDGEAGGDHGRGRVEEIISLYPHVPLIVDLLKT